LTKSTAITPLLILLSLAGCHSSVSSIPELKAVPAQVVVVAASGLASGISISGVVKPHLETDIAAQVTAPITVITKREGNSVHRGEILVRLHSPALEASVEQANATLLSAERQQTAATTQSKLATDTLARYLQLRARHSVTPHELDQMEAQSAAAQADQQTAVAQVAAVRASLAVQRANAADAILCAPFDGVVTQRFADPGTLAVPGMPILHIQAAGQEEVDFSIPEEILHTLHLGSRVPVVLASAASPIEASVTNLSPAGNAASHSFLVKATLPESNSLHVGSVVSVLLPATKSYSSITVPTTALIEQGGLDAVLALNGENRAEVRYITVGRNTGNTVEVLNGLQAGNRILLHGTLSLAGRVIEAQP
jgi:RND family efflux transporter MFP subunit